MNIADCVCLVTGGSSGLGAATVRMALDAGARVVIAERTVETHIARILGKLGLTTATTHDHRRVLAVLRYLEGHRPG